MTQPHRAAVTARGELEPGERVDRDRVGIDAVHIADGLVGVALLEQGADAGAEPGQVVARDRAMDRERDRPSHVTCHRGMDPPVRGKSSPGRPMSSEDGAGQ